LCQSIISLININMHFCISFTLTATVLYFFNWIWKRAKRFLITRSMVRHCDVRFAT